MLPVRQQPISLLLLSPLFSIFSTDVLSSKVGDVIISTNSGIHAPSNEQVGSSKKQGSFFSSFYDS